MDGIYLDYNATTPTAPQVLAAMLPALEQWYGNPSSSHAPGHVAKSAVEKAREQVARLLGCAADEVYFTSGGTESNNLALKGVAFARRLSGASAAGPGHLAISAVEHPATVQPARFLERLGFDVSVVGVDDDGVVNPDDVAAALRPDTMLVSVMHANNEVGTLQPIRAIADRCRTRGVLIHTDAAQSVGKVAVRVDELGVDLLSIAGHKLYAPKGVGAIYIRRGVKLEPLLHGAGHERGLRAGTENVPNVVGLGAAAELARRGVEHEQLPATLRELRERLLQRLRAGVQGLTVNGERAERLPNTLSVNFPGVSGADLLRRTPRLFASTGAACHSDATHLSPTLAAMGVDPAVGRGCIRLSVGRYTTAEQIDQAADMLIAAWRDRDKCV